MKRLSVLLAVVVALVAASIASALTMSGLVTGTGHSGALVSIWSAQGGTGSTYANVNGVYSFTGIVQDRDYYLSAKSCANHKLYNAAPQQYWGGGSVPNLVLVQTAAC